MDSSLEGRFQFLGVLDAFSILIYLILIVYLINSNFNKHQQKEHYKYYKKAFYFKLIISIIFSIIYIRFYYGGDTAAYWDTSQKLGQLLWVKPEGFFHEMFTNSPTRIRYVNFYPVGLPPTWIYQEDEAFFTSKVYTFISLIAFRSYFAMTIISSYFSFKISWFLYEFLNSRNLIKQNQLAYAVLFLPSTSFWCNGITKDLIIYYTVIYSLIVLTKKFIIKEEGFRLNLIKLFICFYLILNIRDFMIIVVFAPLFFALGIKWSNNQTSRFSKMIFRIFIFILSFLMISVFFSSEKAAEFTSEAQLIQQDLKNNTTYGTGKYDLGITDFSPFGMLKAFPISIFTAFYRPFVWEAKSLFVLLSSLESLLFIFLSYKFVFTGNFYKKLNSLFSNEILIILLTFVLILGFFAGYTSGLFGVLVRFKAPILPFLYIILVYHKKETENEYIV